MGRIANTKQYDLEERAKKFARDCRGFLKSLPKTVSNIEDAKQLARSSGSVAANYIEANESLSKRDFLMRIKICKKESKESCLWLNLVDTKDNLNLEEYRSRLLDEANQLMKIFGAIIEKAK